MSRTDVDRRSWTPAQVVSFVAGSALVAVGVIALLRTGLDLGHLTGDEVTVAGLHHTALLGLLEVGAGLLLVVVGAAGGTREGMTFLGVVLMGFGVAVLVDAASFHGALGTHAEHGWVALAAGAFVVLTALLAPVFRRGRGRTGVLAR